MQIASVRYNGVANHHHGGDVHGPVRPKTDGTDVECAVMMSGDSSPGPCAKSEVGFMKWQCMMIAVALSGSLVACKDDSGSDSAASSSATSKATKKDKDKAADGDKATPAKAKLDAKTAEAAYAKTFGDMKSKATVAEKTAELTKLLGAPHAVEGKDSFWWFKAQSGKSCREIKVMEGAGAMMGAAKDKSKCGE